MICTKFGTKLVAVHDYSYSHKCDSLAATGQLQYRHRPCLVVDKSVAVSDLTEVWPVQAYS